MHFSFDKSSFGHVLIYYIRFSNIQRGVYRCEGYDHEICSICSNDISADRDIAIPETNVTCGEAFDYAKSWKNGTAECDGVQVFAQQACCQKNSIFNIDDALDAAEGISSNVVGPCPFCSNMTVVKDLVIPEGDGATCGEVFDYAKTLKVNSDSCQEIQPAEVICCLP